MLFVVLLVVVVVAAVRFFQMVSSVDSCFVWDYDGSLKLSQDADG